MSTQRHQNRGLRKVCGCSRRAWLKCEHSWYLNFRWRKGKHHRISLDKYANKHLGKTEAQELAETLRTAIRNGDYPPAIVPAVPASTPSDITFTKFGELWLERERQDRVAVGSPIGHGSPGWAQCRSMRARWAIGPSGASPPTTSRRPAGRSWPMG